MADRSSGTGIVFYSRSGHSERLARALADRLEAGVVRVEDPKYARGVFGYMRAAYNSLRQTCVLAQQSFASLAQFDRVIVCGPVWTSYPATPISALLRAEVGLPARVALFLTGGGHSPAVRAWDTAARDLGRPFSASAVLGNSQEGTAEETRVQNRFLEDLGADWSAPAAG